MLRAAHNMNRLRPAFDYDPSILHLLPALVLSKGAASCQCGCGEEKPTGALSITWMGLTLSLVWI